MSREAVKYTLIAMLIVTAGLAGYYFYMKNKK